MTALDEELDHVRLQTTVTSERCALYLESKTQAKAVINFPSNQRQCRRTDARRLSMGCQAASCPSGAGVA